jgi:O-antigen/teichoic acid export membrane protein
MGAYRYRMRNQLAAAALNLLLNFWLIPAHGWLGAAWASLACDGLLGVANLAALLWLTAPGRQPAGRGLHEGASGASSDVRPLPPFSEE